MSEAGLVCTAFLKDAKNNKRQRNPHPFGWLVGLSVLTSTLLPVFLAVVVVVVSYASFPRDSVKYPYNTFNSF